MTLILIPALALMLAGAPVTLREHEAIAQKHAASALELESKAKAYEEEAARLARSKNHNPMASKWPAMAAAPVNHLRAKAMQARRQANEMRQLAEKHREQARTLAARNR